MNSSINYSVSAAILTALVVAGCAHPDKNTGIQPLNPDVIAPAKTQQYESDNTVASLTDTTANEERRRVDESLAITNISRRQALDGVAIAPATTMPGQPAESKLKTEAFAGGIIANNNVFNRKLRLASEPVDREEYAHLVDNGIKLAAENPVSTFSIDVDTGSYSNVRRMLTHGQIPRQDAVRTEEMVNYFSYDYPVPEDKKTPFSIHTEMTATPWNPDTKLLHVGIKGYDVAKDQLPPSNLVFLVDVSGSMNSADKLGLLKSSLTLLSKQLSHEDRISIAVYAGAAGAVLPPTAGDQTATIQAALDALSAGGSTNGGAGIRLAYNLAEQGFIKNGINRVIIATDGDFNVGTVNFEALKDLVEEKRKTGISLTTLGFGSGNYNDHLMEQLADVGNGNYAYIDTLHEAQKVLVDEISSTLNTIAKDVKIQIEFNPDVVAEYRLIGYENRLLNREDFNNDKIDAGEIGAGHTHAMYRPGHFYGEKSRQRNPVNGCPARAVFQ
jgi:Ca-activated chloride channel family protein